MKKILLSAAFFAASLSFGQITLEHSFSNYEYVTRYEDGTDVYYISITADNKIKLYNNNYSLKKTISIPIPANFSTYLDYSFDANSYSVSKNIFNTDDKLEFVIAASDYNSTPSVSKLILINEDGILLKDFHPDVASKNYRGRYEVFHDEFANKNKIIVNNQTIDYHEQADVYLLPASSLTTREIQSKTKLSAFPNPAKNILKIENPRNNASRVDVFDSSGKLVTSQSFIISENIISLNVVNLPKGIYFYKIGELSAKFIKE